MRLLERRVTILKETDKAILVKFKASGNTNWIPKDCMETTNIKENKMTAFVTTTIKIPEKFYI